MKNKIIIIVIILVILIAGIGIGIYLSNSDGESGSGSGYYGPEAKEEGVVLNKDDFSINMPKGWAETTAPAGVSTMVLNVNEKITDAAAQKINFKSYFSVIYDTLNGRDKETYVQIAKKSLSQVIPGIVISRDELGKINNMEARFLEAEGSQRGIDFKVLLILITGEGEDVWVLSFNTLQSTWSEYQNLFYQIAESFKLQ